MSISDKDIYNECLKLLDDIEKTTFKRKRAIIKGEINVRIWAITDERLKEDLKERFDKVKRRRPKYIP